MLDIFQSAHPCQQSAADIGVIGDPAETFAPRFGAEEIEQHRAGAVQNADIFDGTGFALQCRPYPRLFQNLGRAVGYGGRAGILPDLFLRVLPVDTGDFEPRRAPQQARQRHPRQPAADNRHVVNFANIAVHAATLAPPAPKNQRKSLPPYRHCEEERSDDAAIQKKLDCFVSLSGFLAMTNYQLKYKPYETGQSTLTGRSAAMGSSSSISIMPLGWTAKLAMKSALE